jgi:hypothetical protein
VLEEEVAADATNWFSSVDATSFVLVATPFVVRCAIIADVINVVAFN